jgi:hypothetical protein
VPKQRIAYALQIVGAVSLVLAGFRISDVVGFVVAGVIGLVFGIALEGEVPSAPADVELADELGSVEG